MIKLALKVETLNKYSNTITTRSVVKEGFAKGSTSTKMRISLLCLSMGLR